MSHPVIGPDGKPAQAWLFDGDDAPLYIDHRGRNILVHHEGPGRLEWSENPGQVEVDTDGTVDGFEEFLACSSEGTPVFEAVVRAGADLPKQFEESGVNRVMGPGWVLSGSKNLEVDHDHRIVRTSDPIWIPFYRSVRAKGSIHVVLDQSHQTEPLIGFSVSEPDSLKAVDWKVQNMSENFELTSTFADGVEYTAQHASHLNKASFSVEIPENARAIGLWKTYDQFHGRQRARVLINDEMAGWWFLPRQGRTNRWGHSQIVLPLDSKFRGESVRVTIDPPSGTPLWNLSTFAVFSVNAL